MLVVIEVDDWEDNEGLLRELRMLQKSHKEIIEDPLFDPDEDVAMRLETTEIVVDVARIVGTLDQSAGLGERTSIKPLEA